ncbi:unnamed protein product [Mesocestoides corti]|uniref:Uncharacterized protein n=1 Tax=Mesocestoides corti TaxID=53468 RepID=A0A0R3UQ83_MESCO|nr:unnamed protein product [Mesocestoides corti]
MEEWEAVEYRQTRAKAERAATIQHLHITAQRLSIGRSWAPSPADPYKLIFDYSKDNSEEFRANDSAMVVWSSGMFQAWSLMVVKIEMKLVFRIICALHTFSVAQEDEERNGVGDNRPPAGSASLCDVALCVHSKSYMTHEAPDQ